MALRLQTVERDVILPVKAVFVGILCYSFFFSRWFEDVALYRSVAQAIVERFFLIYLVLNIGVALALIFYRRWPSPFLQRVIFISNFVDGLFLAALIFVTGGFDSILYWVFLGLIVRNAVSSPLAVPQLILNFSVCLCYLLAGLMDVAITDAIEEGYPVLARAGSQLVTAAEAAVEENPTEPFLLRLIVLGLMTLCCYGVQILLEKQRQADEEEQEFNARQEQLSSAGRLAAQIAHQLKNPLGIINNAAFSLQRALQEGKNSSTQQIQIIREEVERSDRIITKLMGYAQLAEGKVEKLKITEELDRAIQEVFPPGTTYEVRIEKDYSLYHPVLLMQRSHLSEILVNILQNAREATGGRGHIRITTRQGPGNSVDVIISDDGPGIHPDKLGKIFQPYFSTKAKGTGLGLSIVKHNTEIYSGTVRVESGLGKGTRFILHFPTRTYMKLHS